MTTSFIQYGISRIHYSHYGNGANTIVCLHGYGENASSFTFLHEHLPMGYRMIAIDLPYHGDTLWKEKREFTHVDLMYILEEIMRGLNIKERNFSIMGYSLGGRIALSLLEHNPARIFKIVLLAPDGMKVNFWYWLATQTYLGTRLFRFTMKKPAWLLLSLQFADRFKFVNKSVTKFTRVYVGDATARMELFNRWICLRRFKPELKKIHDIILQKKIIVKILYGKHDRIILSKRSEDFREGLNGLCEVVLIDAGHQLLQKKNVAIISSMLTV